MLKNYFKTAFRNLKRNKSFTIINVAGLTVGITSCLLIFLLVDFQTSFDNFHKNRENIYRVVTVMEELDGLGYSEGVPYPLAAALRNDFPQITAVTNINLNWDAQISVLNTANETQQKFKESQGVFFTDPEFFEIFSFKWVAGNPALLGEPNNAALTKETADKYFGSWQNAPGRIIKLNNKTEFKVIGILENVPANTDFPIKAALSYSSLESSGEENWRNINSTHNVYVLLSPDFRSSRFSSMLPAFLDKYMHQEEVKTKLEIQPLNEMHFDTRFHTYGSTFSKELITAISLIGLFLLIIACVNFINLATAQAVNRSREVGVRKVLGGNRAQLAVQFICETFIITLFAVMLALVLTESLLPYLNNLLQLTLSLDLLYNSSLLIFLAAVTALVTLISGFYPAMVLSGFNPITALKSKVTGKSSKISLRRGLVVFQFVIAQVLIIGMLVVVEQMDFFRNVYMGFDKDRILVVPVPNSEAERAQYSSLKNQLLNLPGVKHVSFSTFAPSDDSHWSSDFRFDNLPEVSEFDADLKWADADYFATYGIKLLAGRFYTVSDTVNGFVVNEAMMKKLGIKNPDEILGKELSFWGNSVKAPIVGVAKDFNGGSLEDIIEPVVMGSFKDVYRVLNIKMQPADITNTMASIENLWSSAFPAYVYEYQFLDEKINSFYEETNQLSYLYRIFAAIAIFISCLGLYGLVSFMAAQRTKEVGIRKVLGASSMNIVYLFSKEFTILISIAFIAAAPVSYLIMSKWLEDFAFRIDLGAGIFFTAIAGSLLVAWLTVGYRAVKAATTNPVRSLKYE